MAVNDEERSVFGAQTVSLRFHDIKRIYRDKRDDGEINIMMG